MTNHPFSRRSSRGSQFLARALALAAVAAGAGHALAQAPAPAASSKVSGKEYILTRTSSFQAPPPTARNPFWPIGWTPSAPTAAAAAAPQFDVKPEQFVVTSVSVDYPALAVINGRTRGVGDRIPLPAADGKEAASKETVQVKQILDGQVVLEYRGREMRVSPGNRTKAGAAPAATPKPVTELN